MKDTPHAQSAKDTNPHKVNICKSCNILLQFSAEMPSCYCVSLLYKTILIQNKCHFKHTFHAKNIIGGYLSLYIFQNATAAVTDRHMGR